MSCDGCISSKKMRDAQKVRVRDQAKKYATEKQKDVVIYREIEEWKFVEYEYAIREKIFFSEVVSKY